MFKSRRNGFYYKTKLNSAETRHCGIRLCWRGKNSLIQEQGEADVLVELLTAGHCLLEPLVVEGQDGRRTEDEELLAAG